MPMPSRQRIWHRRIGVFSVVVALVGVPLLCTPCCFAFETKQGRGSIPLTTEQSRFGGVFGGELSQTDASSPSTLPAVFEATAPSPDTQTVDAAADIQPWGSGSLVNERSGRGAHLKHRKSSPKVKKQKLDPCDIFPPDGRLRIQCKQMGMSMMTSTTTSTATMKKSMQSMMISTMKKRKSIANVDTPEPSDVPSSQPSLIDLPRAPHPPASPSPLPSIPIASSSSAPVDPRPPSEPNTPTRPPDEQHPGAPSPAPSPNSSSGNTATEGPGPVTGSPARPNLPPDSGSAPQEEPPVPASPSGTPTDPEGSSPTPPVSNESSDDSTDIEGNPGGPVGSGSTAMPSDPTGNAPSRSIPTTVEPTTSGGLLSPRSPPTQSTRPSVTRPTPTGPIGGSPITTPGPPGNLPTGVSPVITTPTVSPGPRPPAGSTPIGTATATPTFPVPPTSTPGVGGPSTASPTVTPNGGPNASNPITDRPSISPMSLPPVFSGSTITNAPFPSASRLPTKIAPMQPSSAETQRPSINPAGTTRAPSSSLVLPSAAPTLSITDRLVTSAPFSIVFSLPSNPMSFIDAAEDFVSAQARVLEFYDGYFQRFFEDRDETTLLNFDGEILESDPTVPSATFQLHLTFDPASDFIPTEQEIDIFAEIATFEEPFRQEFLDALGDLGDDNLFSQTVNLRFLLRPDLIPKGLAVSSTEGAGRVRLDPFVVTYAVDRNPTEKQKNMTSQVTIAIVDEFFQQWFHKVHPDSYVELIGERKPKLEAKPSQIAFEVSIGGSSNAMQSITQKELEALLFVAFDPPSIDSLLRILGTLPDDNPYAAADTFQVKFVRERKNEVLRRAAVAAVAALSLLIFSTIAFLGNRCWPRGNAIMHGKDEIVNEKLLHGETSHYSAEESTQNGFLQYTGDWDRDEQVIEFSEAGSDDPLLLLRPSSGDSSVS